MFDTDKVAKVFSGAKTGRVTVKPCLNKTVVTDDIGFAAIYKHLGGNHRVLKSVKFYRYRQTVGITMSGKECPFDISGKCILGAVRPEGCKP